MLPIWLFAIEGIALLSLLFTIGFLVLIWPASAVIPLSPECEIVFLNQLMSYLTSTKLKGSIWEKSTQNKFLLHYDESLRKWDKQSGEPLSERMKIRYLSQSVIGVPNLDKVLTTHLSAMKAASKTDYIRYNEYLRLLIEQADIYDGANTSITRTGASRRLINNAESYFPPDYKVANHETLDPDELDIDTPISYLINQAHQSCYRPQPAPPRPQDNKRQVCMDRDTWRSLPKTA